MLARDGVVLLIELKSEKGEISPGQKEWHKAVQGDGIVTASWFVFRPSDRVKIEGILE